MTSLEFEQELEGAAERLECQRATTYLGAARETESGDLEVAPTRCPPDSPYAIRGFSRYSDEIRRLPGDQFAKLQRIYHQIDDSLSGATPVTQVLVAGHADMDATREGREPGFLQFISEKRALTVFFYLSCRLGESKATRVSWKRVGRGARTLAVPNPRTETERKCNRRVEIVLERSAKLLPQLNASQTGPASVDQTWFLEYYHIALQGTSGQYDKSYVAVKKAREIGEKATALIQQRTRKMRENRCSEEAASDFVPYFKDALQGTASKFSDPDVVINKASEIAEHSLYFVQEQEKSKFDWTYASLPQAMAADCEIGGRVAGGPPNHVFCWQHGHILDRTTRTVIAHNLEEYKRLPTTSRLRRLVR